MKKRLLPLIALFSFLGFTSCDPVEDVIDDETPETPACVVTKITSTDFGDFDEQLFTYENDKIKSFSGSYAYEECYINEFEEEICNSNSGVDEIEFNYSQDRLTSIEIKSHSADEPEIYEEVVTIEYSGENISKLVSDQDDYEIRFSYTGNKLTKIEEYEGSEVYYMVVLTWNGDNVSKVEGYNDYSGGGRKKASLFNRNRPKSNQRMNDLTLDFEDVYSNYDDKINPMANMLIYGVLFEQYYFLGKNNIKTINGKRYYNGEIDSEFDGGITYVYNADNFPTKMTFTSDDDLGILDLTYNCE